MIAPIVLEDLTTGDVAGSGVFDKLMQVTRAHLDVEFDKNRIRGPEYSQVYLGQLTQVMSAALQFLLQKDKVALEAQLIEAQLEVAKNQAANLVLEGQNLLLQGQLLAAQKQNLDVERDLTIAKTAQTTQQTQNLVAEKANILLQAPILTQQKLNLVSEGLRIAEQTKQITQQTTNLKTQDLQEIQKTKLLVEQTANAVLEGKVMVATECKLRAEYDVLLETKLKTAQETALLGVKTATERAQTIGAGVDADSVIGKQKSLYQAQADGFKRDAEQKAAKLLVDSWNVRRTTDSGTVADGTNMLNDATVGRAVKAVLAGVGA
jgi:hypothetical protein